MVDPDGLRYVVAYDIPNNRRRTKLAKLLQAYGGRVQLSVFEMVLGGATFDKFISDVTQRIKPKEDRVHIYPVCGACEKKARFLGLSAAADRPGNERFLIV